MIADILDYGDMIYVIYEHGGGAWLQKEALKELEGRRYDKETGNSNSKKCEMDCGHRPIKENCNSD